MGSTPGRSQRGRKCNAAAVEQLALAQVEVEQLARAVEVEQKGRMPAAVVLVAARSEEAGHTAHCRSRALRRSFSMKAQAVVAVAAAVAARTPAGVARTAVARTQTPAAVAAAAAARAAVARGY